MPQKKKKGKGKKGKKPKLSKEEKEKAELQKAAEQITNNPAAFKALVVRMERWFEKRVSWLQEILISVDVQRQGYVTYAQFKAGLLDMHAPCSNAEIFLLTTLLDRNNTEKIYPNDIMYGMSVIKESIAMDENHLFQNTTLDKTRREFDRCSQCNIALFEPPKIHYTYVMLEMRLIPLLHVRNQRFHTKFLFPLQSLVQKLIGELAEMLDIASTKISIYKDATKQPETLLPLEKNLEECGFIGGPYNDPLLVILYYDYMAEFGVDSPILLSDDFFMYKTCKKTTGENEYGE